MTYIPDAPYTDEAARRRQAGEVFDAALTGYFADRHALVDRFVDRHFTVRGSLALHRKALGWDLLRVPANLLLTVPTAALKVGAAGARWAGASRLARWLDTRNLFLNTAVARRIETLIRTELLGMPAEGDVRTDVPPMADDALFERMLADGRLARMLRNETALSASRTASIGLTEILTTYKGTRTAAGEVSTACLSLGIGAMAFGKMTPGMISLGPSLAAFVAHQAAVTSFPLGASLGGLWYALFPAPVATDLLVGSMAALMLASAVLAAFAGVVADPVQRRLGLHQKRLHRMLDVLETNLRGPAQGTLTVKDHYVARLLDLLDYAAVAARYMRPG
jgi:hypothetical protein